MTPTEPLTYDVGESPAVLTAAVNYSGPDTASVEWYDSASPLCSSSSTDTGTPGLAFTPSTASTGTAYYCAVVFDDGLPGYSSASNPVEVTIDTLLNAGAITPSSPAIDVGQYVTLQADPSGGSGSYSFQWYAGAGCAVPIIGADSQTYNASSTSGRSYSYRVNDSTSASVCVAFPAAVTVNARLSGSLVAVFESPPPQVRMTAAASGGTSPYSYQWYAGPGCTGGEIEGANSSTYAASPLGSTDYSVDVTDSSAGSPPASSCVGATVGTGIAVGVSPSSIDAGQSAVVAVTVTWGGGTPPYSVTLRAGLSGNCSSDTDVVGTNTGVVGASTTFSLPSPASTTRYCATVTDSGAAPLTTTSSAAVFTVNPGLAAALPPETVSDTGQSVTLRVAPSLGTPPYHYQWYAGAGCGVALPGATSSSYETGTLTGNSTYSVNVTDSSSGSGGSGVCASATVLVNPRLTAAISPADTVLDVRQPVMLTAVPSQGTPGYRYQWYDGGSCSGSPIHGATRASLVVSPTSSMAYSALVTDASAGTPPAIYCAAAVVAFNPATTLSLACSRDSAVVGTTVSCKATVFGSTPLGPSGYVFFSSNGTGTFSSVTCWLSRHAAYSICHGSFQLGAAGVVAAITATYYGDSSHSGSVGTFYVAVTPKPSRTFLFCSPTSVVAGSSRTVTCTVVVDGYSPTGTVDWSQSGVGSVAFGSGSCVLAAGRCEVTLTGTSPGRVDITATYVGDSNNAASSRTVVLRVNPS